MAKYPKRIILIIFIDILLIIIAGFGIFRVSEKVTIPCEFEPDSLFITKLTTENPNELKIGDTLRALNHVRISNKLEIEFINDGFGVGDKIPVTIERESKILTFDVILHRNFEDFYIFTVIAVALLYFFLGIFVLLRKYNELFSNVFHWLLVFIALDISLSWGRYYHDSNTMDIIIRSLFSIAKIMHSILLLHFSILFPFKKWVSGNKIVFPFYIIAIIGSGWMAFLNYEVMATKSIEWFSFYDKYFHDGILRYFFGVCVVYAFINFIHSYIHSKEESERRKLLWIFLGVSIPILLYILLYMIPNSMGKLTIMTDTELILIMSVPCITFMIAIYRYRIMDIDLIISRGVLYTGIIAFLTGINTGIIYVASKFLEGFAIEGTLVLSFIAAILVAIFFQPAKQRLQTLIDKKFFIIKYNFRIAQQNFSLKIRNSFTPLQIAETVIKTINEIIPTDRIAFLSYNINSNQLELINQINFPLNEIHLSDIKNLCFLNIMRHPIALEGSLEEGSKYVKLDNHLLIEAGISALFSTYSEDEHLINAVIVGRKLSKVRYSFEDIDMLQFITNQSGLAIQRLNLQNKLTLKEEEAKKLYEINKMKSFFVSSVSHELKTPLTSIRLFAEILSSKKNLTIDKQVEYLDIIQGECDRLNRLINNVLDFSKIESGIKHYNFMQIDINQIIEDVLKSFEYQFKLNHFNVHLSIDENPFLIHGDSDAMMEVYINLISNSIKYSLERKELTINTFELDNKYYITIKDEGIGISDEDLAHIFEPFYRSKDIKASQSGGTGIGLSIVQNIIKAHGGSIDVKSKQDEGTIFTIYFPINESSIQQTNSSTIQQINNSTNQHKEGLNEENTHS